VDRQITALLCRTSDRGTGAATGTKELAGLVGARIIGSPGEPRSSCWEDDLRDSRGCLLEAGGQVDDTFVAGRAPILLAGECSVAVATLPVVVRHHPDVRVLWLDAHGDFNTPDTSASGYLGGMCLAGACGLWDTGFGAGLDPARVVMHGVRDLDAGERVALDTRGVYRNEKPAQLQGMALFVHLDLDVLDPDVMPSAFPVPGGMTATELRAFLAEVATAATIVGAEVTAAAPGYGEVAADAIAPLLV
jgi:arginase family enzyme